MGKMFPELGFLLKLHDSLCSLKVVNILVNATYQTGLDEE